MKNTRHALAGSILLTTVLASGLQGCRSTGYTASLSLTGAENQEDFVDTLHAAVDAQTATQAEFVEGFKLLTQLQKAPAEEVHDRYDALLDQIDVTAEQYEASQEQIELVRERGATLFAAWNEELEQFSSGRLRSRSEERMQHAQEQLTEVDAQLRNVQGRMERVLMEQRDYILFFNHNLGAYDSLSDESDQFAEDAEALDNAIDSARRHVRRLVEHLQGGPSGL